MQAIFDRRYWKIWAIVVVLVVSALILVSLNDESKRCGEYSCFEKAMKSCEEGVSYVNEEPEASWMYEIEGKEKGLCAVEVKLALAKEGELGIAKLQGMEMLCGYPVGVGAYPEKDLDKCHGLLKEELQKIVIDKLHKYIIENLGAFDDALNKK